ncbi:MAG: RsmB/NOP family class I SAM-dependent RNA methyltransferase [Oscillospiraceae bacterium]|nr:RsmB/NOP family class I SAM-dependent RNA methyltransferase [Oscillospiraceae bacterium]
MLPELFCGKMQALLGPEYELFLRSLDRPRALGLRLNPLKIQRQREKEFLDQLSSFSLSPVPWCSTGYYYNPESRPGLHPWHAAGAYYLQEPSAMAPAELLDPQPGERVLDLCAAPGGKTTQLAGKMAGRGLLVCNEIHPKRAAVLSSNVERMGIANALVLNEHPARLAERFAGYFDRVLVDAPCSGEGMFRKHDAAGADWSPETVAMCARRQAEILDNAAVTLRPGGRLVYSTCTFSPEENEGSVEAFLDRHPDYFVEAVSAPHFAPGRPEWSDGNPALARTFRLWPHHLLGEGHFAAVLRRSGDEPGTELLTERNSELPKPVAELVNELGIELPVGNPVRFGERVFLTPKEMPALRGLKVLRPGLELAELRRDLAVPAHALALWSREAVSCHDLRADDPACAAYLRGETLPTEARGWTLVRVEGLSMGWGKASVGVLKNHYPKGLRIF